MCKCRAFCREGAQLLHLCGCLILVLEGGLCRGSHAILTASAVLANQRAADVGHLGSAGSFGEHSDAVLAWQVPACGIRAVVGSGLRFSRSPLLAEQA